MNKTQFKDAVRNIKKKIVSWIAIIIVIMIGAGCYMGGFFYSDSLKDCAADYLKAMNYRELMITATRGVCAEDIKSLSECENIKEAEGCFILQNAHMILRDDDVGITLMSETKTVNIPQIKEGRLPLSDDECAVSADLMKRFDISIGDTISLDIGESAPAGMLKQNSFTVTGSTYHVIGLRSSDEYSVIVSDVAFDKTLYDDRYNTVFLTTDNSEYMDYLSEEYFNDLYLTEKNLKGTLDLMRSREGGYLILTRSEIEGYLTLQTIVVTLKKMMAVFSSVFLVISGIVCFSTSTIIIGEQLKQIGTTKAFGMSVREILAKYIIFGCSAVLTGMLLSIMLAVALEKTLTVVLGVMFCCGLPPFRFEITVLIILTLIGLVTAIAAILISGLKVIRKPAVQLMSGKIDSRQWKKKACASRRGTLFTGLIFRNMISDLPRVIVSIVVVMGSCLIIGAGFTIRDAFGGMMPANASEVMKYDLRVTISSQDATDELEKIKELLVQKGASFEEGMQQSLLLEHEKTHEYCQLFMIDPALIPGTFGVVSASDDEALTLSDDGVLVFSRLNERTGIKKGDDIIFYDLNTQEHCGVVDELFRNYYGGIILISPVYYEKLFGSIPANNTLFVHKGENDRKYLEAAVKEIYPDASIFYPDRTPEGMKSVEKLFDFVVLLMIALAVMISIFVLLNLIDIFVRKRTNDLIIMQINGFSHMECIGYLWREIVVMVVTGMIFAVIAGMIFTESIVRILETNSSMFVRSFDLKAWVISVLMETLFAVIITFFAFRRIRSLNLTSINEG